MIKLSDLLRERVEVGDRVVIPKGKGYNTTSPISFKRSDGNVEGTVTAFQAGRAYIKLDSGQVIYTRHNLVEPVNEAVKPAFTRDRYDKLASEFYKKTGMLAPGKDVPAGMDSPPKELRTARWLSFLKSKGYKLEAVAPKWKGDYVNLTKGLKPGSPEMKKKLKSLWAKCKCKKMPTFKGGKIVCGDCGVEYLQYKGGAVHPETPVAKALIKKGIIKK